MLQIPCPVHKHMNGQNPMSKNHYKQSETQRDSVTELREDYKTTLFTVSGNKSQA